MAAESGPRGADAALRKIRDEAVSDIMRDAEPDADLLRILNGHMVTLAPNASAVEQAVADIHNLAKRRVES